MLQTQLTRSTRNYVFQLDYDGMNAIDRSYVLCRMITDDGQMDRRDLEPAQAGHVSTLRSAMMLLDDDQFDRWCENNHNYNDWDFDELADLIDTQ